MRQLEKSNDLSQQKSAMDREYQLKRDELIREQNASNLSLSTMERVLDETKTVNEKLSKMRHQKALLEDELNQNQYDRTKLEQKVGTLKQKQVTDEVQLE